MSKNSGRLSQLKNSSKNAFNRVISGSQVAYENVQNFLFGVNVGDAVELESVRSFDRSSINKRIPSDKKKRHSVATIGADETAGQEESYDNIENCRNLVVSASTLFRKGPIPIESLSHQEQIRLSRLGCLKEWDDSDIATSDNAVDFQENPVSKSLLSYFSRSVFSGFSFLYIILVLL